ncbi:MAG: hypothetical protein AAGC74_01440 [Verrucomicrobiota bacterium]
MGEVFGVWKFLLVLGLVPVGAAVALRKFYADKAIAKLEGEKAAITGESFFRKLMTGAGLKMELKLGRMTRLKEEVVELSEEVGAGRPKTLDFPRLPISRGLFRRRLG